MYKYRIVKRYYQDSTEPYFVVQKRAWIFLWTTYSGEEYGYIAPYPSEEAAARAIGKLIELDKAKQERKRLIKQSPKVVRYF